MLNHPGSGQSCHWFYRERSAILLQMNRNSVMHRDRDSLPPLREIYRALRHSGLRMTVLKREIVDLFAQRGACGISAGEIIDGLSATVRPSTVYRCLESLVEVGFLRRARTSGGVYRYRMGERFAGHHDHFRCSSCGRMQMVTDALPRSLLDGLERKYGFSVNGFDLHLEGMCEDCLGSRTE